MEPLDKLEKFILRLSDMVDMLEEHREDRHITSSVNQYYYIQKLEELKQYHEIIQETTRRMEFFAAQFGSEYAQVYARWKTDVRWLNTTRLRMKKYE